MGGHSLSDGLKDLFFNIGSLNLALRARRTACLSAAELCESAADWDNLTLSGTGVSREGYLSTQPQ